MRRVAALLLVVTLVPACRSGSGDEGRVVLDGRPRYPDAEGVVTAVSLAHVSVGGRRYPVSDELQCFSTTTLEALPLLQRKSQFVQVGVHDGKVRWLASYGVVVRPPAGLPTVFYTGVFERLDQERRAVFEDGSVLRLESGVSAPLPGRAVRADIDPATGRIRALSPT